MKKTVFRLTDFVLIVSLFFVLASAPNIAFATETAYISSNNHNDVIVLNRLTLYESLASAKNILENLGFTADPNPFQSALNAYVYHAPSNSKTTESIIMMTPDGKLNRISIIIKKGAKNYTEVIDILDYNFGERKHSPMKKTKMDQGTLTEAETYTWSARNAEIKLYAHGDTESTLKSIQRGTIGFVININSNGEPEIIEETQRINFKAMTLGSEGTDVEYMQNALLKMGFKDVTVNGVFDAATFAAVYDFQTENGLVADGVVTPDVLATIFKSIKE